MHINQYILVYGATGLVGKELVYFLTAKEFNVVALVRNTEKAEKLFGSEITIFSSIEELIRLNIEEQKECIGIVNLVGANLGGKYWSNKYKDKIITSRTESVKRLGEFVNQLNIKPKVWLQASAVGYYGANVVEPSNEKGKKGTGFLADVVDKWESSLEAIDLPNTRKVFLRFGIVMTTKGGFLKKIMTLSNFGAFVFPNIKEQKLAWIHITDLISLIEIGLNNNSVKGKINAVSSQPLKMKEFGTLIKNNTRAFVLLKAPVFLFQVMLGKLKANEMVLANQNITSAVLPAINFKFRFEKPESFFENEKTK